MGNYPGLSGGRLFNNHRGLSKRESRRLRSETGDVMTEVERLGWLALKMEDRATSQGIQDASTSWKRQILSKRFQKECWHLDFRPMRLFWTSHLQNCEIIIIYVVLNLHICSKGMQTMYLKLRSTWSGVLINIHKILISIRSCSG